MSDELLQDLWFHHADDVALDTITLHDRRVTLHATPRRSPPLPTATTDCCTGSKAIDLDSSATLIA
ncbi:hypothetical protein OTB20_39915 [Streptomyces sp. H27-H1]|uniref:hypothetical protein n=1 Tax=Streptomyces sp. H27-H1 TaxID=2996461 RepID=UPI0022721664|nr:hypothetical protein [Streptomyces sp. H27-H1]MCY0932222.1 hypothetical protein [Streptomyces sp. H27-H1]